MHKGHPDCPHPTSVVCDKERREALGRCTAMTADRREAVECRKWATSLIDGKPICTQHAEGILNRQLATAKAAARKAELDARITAFMERTARVPSVWG